MVRVRGIEDVRKIVQPAVNASEQEVPLVVLRQVLCLFQQQQVTRAFILFALSLSITRFVALGTDGKKNMKHVDSNNKKAKIEHTDVVKNYLGSVHGGTRRHSIIR